MFCPSTSRWSIRSWPIWYRKISKCQRNYVPASVSKLLNWINQDLSNEVLVWLITISFRIVKQRPKGQGHAFCKLVGCIDWFFITFIRGVGHSFLHGYGYRNLVQYLMYSSLTLHSFEKSFWLLTFKDLIVISWPGNYA